MLVRRNRALLWGAIALCLGIIFYALYAQYREANDTHIVPVALDPSDPARTRIGELEYLGGLDIPPMGQDIGGLSGLRWDAESGRLLAVTDDARWVWMTPVEEDGRLVGVSDFEVGDLLGIDGEVLTGKEQGDSESLTRSAEGGWLVGFERDHRVLRYPSLNSPGQATDVDPVALLGPLENNSGIEALAGNERDLVLCAERYWDTEEPNCVGRLGEGADVEPLYASAAAAITELGGVPTDADMGKDGSTYILFRSYSPSDGNGASITAYRPDSTRHVLMALLPPLTVDNFEGLAVREEALDDGTTRTFLYIVSDDNFSSSQRTLLMKFEVVAQ